MRAFVGAIALAVAGLLWAAAPSIGEAQQCYDVSACPAGAACVNGQCIMQQAQPQPEGTPPPGYGQAPQPQGYGQAGYGQAGYVQPQPQPQPQARVETGHIVGLIVSGAVVLGVSWILNMVVSGFGGVGSAVYSDSQWEAFRYTGLVPVLGPWIQLALKPGPLDNDGWAQYLVIDGILQAAGLTMLILGIAIPVERTVYGENGESEGIDLAIVPNFSPNTAGLGLVGRF